MSGYQAEYQIRCEWGEFGVAGLAPVSDAVIIVDVLSFSTTVEIATARGAIVYPYQWKDLSSHDFAESVGAVVAGSRRMGGFSLSSTSVVDIPVGQRLVLPSPNGSTLSIRTGRTPTFAGCLRNGAAVARAAQQLGGSVAVIPAGERWPDGSLRPCVEDIIGAGLIIAHLKGTLSPESKIALDAYRGAADDLRSALLNSVSGKELQRDGYDRDIDLAAAALVSRCVPRLRDGAYVNEATAE
jgi:2-phosphosulfolactate phosphatase